MAEFIDLRIKRQDNPNSPPYWEEFTIPYSPEMNVLSCLTEIRENPVNAAGKKTSPVAFESTCLEEVCGACTMVINARVRQACSALVDQLSQPIVLEPMTKFPVVRDVMVDRNALFESMKRVKAWIDLDGTYGGLGPCPPMSQKDQEKAYHPSRCMVCGCCVEACPQFNSHSDFMGPAALAQVYFHDLHPIGKMQKADRLEALMKRGGIHGCGNAQNCVEVCPKEIPLTNIIGELGWEVTVQAVKRFIRR